MNAQAISDGIVLAAKHEIEDFRSRATDPYDVIVYARGVAAYRGLVIDDTVDYCRAYSPIEGDSSEITVQVRAGNAVVKAWNYRAEEV